MIAMKSTLPDKLKMRDHILHREHDPIAVRETTKRTVNTYVLCKDGQMIPVEDEAVLALVEENILPSRP